MKPAYCITRVPLYLLLLALMACQPTALSPTPPVEQPPSAASLPRNAPSPTATSLPGSPPSPIAPATPTVSPEPGFTSGIASLDSTAKLRIMDLAATQDGGFVAVGQYWPADNNTRAWLLKFNPRGEIEWQRTYDGERSELGSSVAALRNGDYLFAGITRSFGLDANGFAVRVDEDGDVIWQKYFGVDGVVTILQAVEAPNGEIAIGGETEAFENGFPGWWVAMLKPDGAISWSASIHRGFYDLLHGIAVSGENELVIIGDTASSLSGPWESTVIRMDLNGRPIADSLYAAGGEAYSRASVLNGQGNTIFVTQFRNGLVSGLLVVDPAGEILWERRYKAQEPRSMILTRDGAYVLGGRFSGGGERYGWLMKVDPDGEVLWSHRYDAARSIDAVIETASGALVAVGHTDEPSSDYGPVMFFLTAAGQVPGCADISPLTISYGEADDAVSVSEAAHRIRPIVMFSEDIAFSLAESNITPGFLCQGSR